MKLYIIDYVIIKNCKSARRTLFINLFNMKCHQVGLQIEGPGMCSRQPIVMPSLPKPLSLEEKKYLLAVERGDAANVRR